MSRALSRYGEELLDLYPQELRPDMAAAMQELLRDAFDLAREVDAAERAGIPFAEAARDTATYPTMARAHFGLLDLLHTEFAPHEHRTLEHVVTRAADADVDHVRRNWFLVAAEDRDTLSGPLMRFLLYQAVRLNVWVLTWGEGAALEATGAFRELDERAEVQLRSRLAMDEMHDPAVRPLHVLVAEAVDELSQIWDTRKRELTAGSRDAIELFRGLARAADVARNLGAGDAALVRNEIEGATGGEQIGSRELSERCPSLASQNATDQRRRRLLARLHEDAAPEPSGLRFIDLLSAKH